MSEEKIWKMKLERDRSQITRGSEVMVREGCWTFFKGHQISESQKFFGIDLEVKDSMIYSLKWNHMAQINGNDTY